MVIQLVEQVLHTLSEQSSTEVTPFEAGETTAEDKKETSSSQDMRQLIKLDWKVTPVITRRIEESASNVDR